MINRIGMGYGAVGFGGKGKSLRKLGKAAKKGAKKMRKEPSRDEIHQMHVELNKKWPGSGTLEEMIEDIKRTTGQDSVEII